MDLERYNVPASGSQQRPVLDPADEALLRVSVHDNMSDCMVMCYNILQATPYIWYQTLLQNTLEQSIWCTCGCILHSCLGCCAHHCRQGYA